MTFQPQRLPLLKNHWEDIETLVNSCHAISFTHGVYSSHGRSPPIPIQNPLAAPAKRALRQIPLANSPHFPWRDFSEREYSGAAPSQAWMEFGDNCASFHTAVQGPQGLRFKGPQGNLLKKCILQPFSPSCWISQAFPSFTYFLIFFLNHLLNFAFSIEMVSSSRGAKSVLKNSSKRR